MAAASLTFEQIESSTGKTYAFAVFAEHARTGISVAFRIFALFLLAKRLKKLISVGLSSQSLERLTEDQAKELLPLIRNLHTQLVRLSKSCPPDVERIPLLSASVNIIEESAEELDEVLEDLVLMHDTEFNSLISRSVAEVRKTTHLEAMHH